MSEKKDKKETVTKEEIGKEADSISLQIERVMNLLGRTHSEGNVKGDNLSKVLTYLIMQKTEAYGKMLSKLALVCGMQKRYVKENYIDGLEGFYLIRIYMNGNEKHWEWLGIKQ